MPGKEMDLFIATEIMGGAVLPYSTDLNAAWIVWQRISKSYQLLIADNKGSTEIFRVFETNFNQIGVWLQVRKIGEKDCEHHEGKQRHSPDLCNRFRIQLRPPLLVVRYRS